ncbi:MAG: hypothetical protein HZA50_01115 [Planctomycetes bacterium]|nr:hypothetical protein [Planctomycetota bacterium]
MTRMNTWMMLSVISVCLGIYAIIAGVYSAKAGEPGNKTTQPATNPAAASSEVKLEELIESAQKLAEDGVSDIKLDKLDEGNKKFEAALKKAADFSESAKKVMNKDAEPAIDYVTGVFKYYIYNIWSKAFEHKDPKKAEEYNFKAGDSIVKPNPRPSAIAGPPPGPIIITLRPLGDGSAACEFILDGQTMTEPEQLYQLLCRKKEAYGPGVAETVPVIIRPLQGVRWKLVVEAFNQTLRAQFREIGFANTDETENKTTQPATAQAASAEEIKKLIAQLGDSDVKVRDAAYESLAKIGQSIQPALMEKLKEKDLDPEISKRIERLFEKWTCWGDVVNGIKTGLSCGVRRYQYENKTGFAERSDGAGEPAILLNVTVANNSGKDIRYYFPEFNEAYGWRACFRSEQGARIYAKIHPLSELDIALDNYLELKAGASKTHEIRAVFGTTEWLRGTQLPGKNECSEYGLQPFGKKGMRYVPAVPPLTSGKYTVAVSYDDRKGCVFSTGGVEIEIVGPGKAVQSATSPATAPAANAEEIKN